MRYSTPQYRLRAIAERLQAIVNELVDPSHADAIQAHVDGLMQLAETITPKMVGADALTPQQARVLGFIRQRITQKGEAPTRKEIGEAFGFSSANAAQEHIRALDRKGAITLTGGARGIRINTPAAARETLTAVR